jgi:hypothetical protein
MSHGRRVRRVARGLAVVAAVLLLAGSAGCDGTGGGTPAAQAPRPPRGAPTPVDVCRLLSGDDQAALLGGRLRPVSLEYQAARIPTLQCDLGRRFEAPDVSVVLAIGPVSEEVFSAAYGDAAGGDPLTVRRLGQAAYLRTEDGHRDVHVLAHGSIVTLRWTIDPLHPLDRDVQVRLARRAVVRLPRNPRLASTGAGPRCSQVPLAAVTAAVGAQPSLLSSLEGPRGSVVCSWASEPGVAVVRTVASPARVSAYRAATRTADYGPVHLRGAGAHVTALSRVDRAGDLLVFHGGRAATIAVVPTAGFSNQAIATTPGETRLAAAVVSALM